MDWKLHFWDQYIINNNNKSLRIHDLIIAAYKIKSHKFGNWFEDYEGILELDIYKNALLGKKELVVVIEFYHAK